MQRNHLHLCYYRYRSRFHSVRRLPCSIIWLPFCHCHKLFHPEFYYVFSVYTSSLQSDASIETRNYEFLFVFTGPAGKRYCYLFTCHVLEECFIVEVKLSLIRRWDTPAIVNFFLPNFIDV